MSKAIVPALFAEVKSRIEGGEDDATLLSYLETLSWNEVRALKAKLMSQTNTPAADGGRTKSELQVTICRLARIVCGGGAGGDDAKLEEVKQEAKEATPPAAVKEEVKQAAEEKTPAEPETKRAKAEVDATPASRGPFKLPAGGDGLPAFVNPLPADARASPKLADLGFLRNSLEYEIACNDVSLTVLDSCFTGVDEQGQAERVWNLAALGEALVLNSNLLHLVVPFSGLGDAGLTALFGKCVESGHHLGLRTLDVRHNHFSKASGALLASLVALCPNLQRLRLEGNELTDAALSQVLVALPASLESLSLSQCSDKVAAGALATNVKRWPRLFELSVTHGTVGDAGVEKVCAALMSVGMASQLARLDVRHNQIKQATTHLAQLLFEVPSCWWVQAEGNPCAEHSTALRDTAREKFQAFFEALHPTLELRRVLSNGNRKGAADAASPEALERLCACLATGIDVRDEFMDVTEDTDDAREGSGMVPLKLCAARFADPRMLALLLATPEGPEAAKYVHQEGGSLVMLEPAMSAANLRLLLEAGMLPSPVLSTPAPPCLVSVATQALSVRKTVCRDRRSWLHRVTMLLAHGVDVDRTDDDGETALSVFSRAGQGEVVGVLLQHGASRAHVDRSFENTPLHWACQYGNAEVVRTLLKGTNDVAQLCGARNKAGETPLDLARRYAQAPCELEIRFHTK